ncbi:MAG: hypothetical protein OXH59_01340 [Rhodospirillaceae bacterium]|nr:hypothetical protein [Rhodospirillaceae bacterium]
MGKPYSHKAQPYLDAIANAVFSDRSVRDWLVTTTRHEPAYFGAKSLDREQRARRPDTKQPFYCNYWRCKYSPCRCRTDGKFLETDAVFFLEAVSGRRLAAHVEFKHPGERFGPGQAEGYPLRAACWADRDRCPGTVLPHDDWLTVIFCGDTEIDDRSVDPFDRRIGHSEARATIPGYPEFIERTG